MAQLSVQTISRDGLTPTMSAAAGGGDKFSNNAKTWLHVVNGGGSPITVTIATEGAYDGLAVPDREVAVAAGAVKLIGPFPKDLYNDDDDNVNVSYSGTTSVTVAAIKLGA